MKILNLYAGIGGNRKLWKNVDVTAIELNPQIAEVYKYFFQNDNVIICDAHKYLLEHFQEFDFIWSSPPCPTHSRFNFLNNQKIEQGIKPKYPDMKLYEEIIFLKYWFKGKYCVENVISYYEPLIKPTECNNHYFWHNFYLKPLANKVRGIRNCRNHIEIRCKQLDFDINKINTLDSELARKILNNCVEPEIGLHILEESKKNLYQELFFRKEVMPI